MDFFDTFELSIKKSLQCGHLQIQIALKYLLFHRILKCKNM